jgi:hypothetical protein
MSLMTKTTAFPDIPWNERYLSDNTWTDDQFVQASAKRTARLTKIAIHETLAELDPRLSLNNVQRHRSHSRLAVLLVPALARRVSAKSSQMIRAFHLHGWIILNPKPLRFSTTLDTPDTEQMRQVRIMHNDIPTSITVPEPVGLLAAKLMDALGTNMNICPTPDVMDLLLTRADYATRNNASENTFPHDVVLQPRWFWTRRLKLDAVA